MAKPLTVKTAYQQANQLSKEGKSKEAKVLLHEILKAQPYHGPSLTLLGTLYYQEKDYPNAELQYRRALAEQPRVASTHYNLALLLAAIKDYEESVGEFELALKYEPNYVQAWNSMGNTLRLLGESDKAEKALKKAISLSPTHARAHINLWTIFAHRGDWEGATKALKKAISLKPNDYMDQQNLGIASMQMHRWEDAETALRKAVHLAPQQGTAHLALADFLLTHKRFEEGWREYEFRLMIAQSRAFRLLVNRFPFWRGEDLADKCLFVHGEQGAGDNLQFCRYLPLIAEKAKRVLFWPGHKLEHVLEGQNLQVDLVETPELAAEQGFDYHTPLLSLAHYLKVDEQLIPAAGGYLKAQEEKRKSFQERFFQSKKLKLGLAWQGNPEHQRDKARSIPLKQILPYLPSDKFQLYSLQKGFGEEQLEGISDQEIIPLGPDFDDFSDTAAALSNLDLLVTIDSALAHLGGAMGIPTWVLLTYVPDWRWFLDSESSPWYDSVRLFRQENFADWDSALSQLGRALESFTFAR